MKIWDKEAITAEAKKYKQRYAFQKGCSGGYHRALREGYLDEVCEHMISPQHESGYWTRERIAADAKKYSTKSDWFAVSATAYKAAKRKGIFEIVTAHMPLRKPKR